MLLLPCPFCGDRDETEFVNGGPARPPRPGTGVGDEAWIDWLTVPRNPVGYVEEWWWHARGCGQWFKVSRHTATHHVKRDGGKRAGAKRAVRGGT